MSIFSPRQPHEQQPVTSHPETVEASPAVRAEVAPITAERQNTIYAAREHVLAILAMPEWQPTIHDPVMAAAARQSQLNYPSLDTAPVITGLAAENNDYPDELIDPALSYAKADVTAISHDYRDDQSDTAEAEARAAASRAYSEVAPAAEQSAPAPWQERTEAGINDPYVPIVVQDVDRLTADLDQDQRLEQARSRLEEIHRG